ncbi:MAG TPA: hypothetical protein VFO36_12540 [Nitrospiraceae bacterium]|nr:hypothetical protein [Nitrospiraceae bacterium]
MKVRFLTAIAGSNWSARPKQVREVPDAEGARYVAAGIAAEVVETVPESENDAKPKAARGRKAK